MVHWLKCCSKYGLEIGEIGLARFILLSYLFERGWLETHCVRLYCDLNCIHIGGEIIPFANDNNINSLVRITHTVVIRPESICDISEKPVPVFVINTSKTYWLGRDYLKGKLQFISEVSWVLDDTKKIPN